MKVGTAFANNLYLNFIQDFNIMVSRFLCTASLCGLTLLSSGCFQNKTDSYRIGNQNVVEKATVNYLFLKDANYRGRYFSKKWKNIFSDEPRKAKLSEYYFYYVPGRFVDRDDRMAIERAYEQLDENVRKKIRTLLKSEVMNRISESKLSNQLELKEKSLGTLTQVIDSKFDGLFRKGTYSRINIKENVITRQFSAPKKKMFEGARISDSSQNKSQIRYDAWVLVPKNSLLELEKGIVSEFNKEMTKLNGKQVGFSRLNKTYVEKSNLVLLDGLNNLDIN